MFSQLGSTLASLFFFWTMFQQYFPANLQARIEKFLDEVMAFFHPYMEIFFHEFSSDLFARNEAYVSIEHYLSSKSAQQARRLKGETFKHSQSLVLGMEDYQEVSDEFQGVKLSWSKVKVSPRTKIISFYPSSNEKRYYKLTFHDRNREFVTKIYLKHVLEEGKAIGVRTRQRKLYTNGPSSYDSRRNKWSHIVFQHPASFETLAMDPVKKEELMEDLLKFSKAKDYYAKIGKAWKRGYLLYGPPGTGKSTLIAAIANFLNYDIYDLEITAVKDNADLRKLLIEISSKSIIVIEDIDCSLDLTGQRKNKKGQKEGSKEGKDPLEGIEEEEEESGASKVTLSGLLNAVDGIWSASGGERIIIFTTNYVEKLDQALIRRGRMDKHIELSYCDFEGFKVLAKNYLAIDSHCLFEPIRRLLEETKMTPADVAENLMPKTVKEDAETCLEVLIQELKSLKEQERKKREEEQMLKAGEESNESKEKVLPAWTNILTKWFLSFQT